MIRTMLGLAAQPDTDIRRRAIADSSFMEGESAHLGAWHQPFFPLFAGPRYAIESVRRIC